MNIQEIFSTEERIEIIRNIINKNTLIRVNRISKELDISKGLVSKYLKILTKEGLLKRTKSGYWIKEGPVSTAIRLLLNIEDIDISLFKRYGFVIGVGLYGSMAKGTNNEDSDMDMYVLVEDVEPEELAGLTKRLMERYGNLTPLYLTKEKLKDLRNEDEVFYHSLLFGSIKLYGEDIGEV